MQNHPSTTEENTGWPTTLRFSRRLGEYTRGPEYAMAIEGPRWRRVGHGAWLKTTLRALGLGEWLSASVRRRAR
jgi:hypothetical protein